NYPWDGEVTLTIDPKAAREFELHVRIPGWCEGATLSINDQASTIDVQNGYARIARTWNAGDTVKLNLPMPVKRIYADPRVKADVGRVALMRGPIVYCLEGVDLKESNSGRVRNLVLPRDSKPRAER